MGLPYRRRSSISKLEQSIPIDTRLPYKLPRLEDQQLETVQRVEGLQRVGEIRAAMLIAAVLDQVGRGTVPREGSLVPPSLRGREAKDGR